MPLKTETLKLLVIVGEAVIREQLMAELKSLGVASCTATVAASWNAEDVGVNTWEGPAVRLESIVTAERADAILTVLAERYFPKWTVVAWLSDVAVVRASRFAGSSAQ